MKKVTSNMIKDYQIDKKGFDFMGYTYLSFNSLSFHHLRISHKDCLKRGMGHCYQSWNGAILTMRTSHQYLHIIEKFDPDVFDFITNEMIDENVKRTLSIESLKRIRSALLSFEREHCSTRNSRKKLIIRPRYIENRIKL